MLKSISKPQKHKKGKLINTWAHLTLFKPYLAQTTTGQVQMSWNSIQTGKQKLLNSMSKSLKYSKT